MKKTGLITIVTLEKHQQEFAGAVLSGPAIALGAPVPATTLALLKIFSANLPKLQVDKLDITTLVTYMPIKDLYQNDPLVYHGGLPARLASELLSKLSTITTEVGPKITLPYLLIHGKSDKICGIEGSDSFHASTKSTDKQYERVDGMHETLNEQGQALSVIVNWLKSKL
jgi:alpha-beta hydrolase superfamily lysophospholipase